MKQKSTRLIRQIESSQVLNNIERESNLKMQVKKLNRYEQK